MPNKVNYKKIVPKDSFIGRYLELMEDTETARAYDFWCACWLLTSVVGRYTKVDRPRAPVWLNWYVILVAEAATTRKSTAIKMAHRILSRVEGITPKSVVSGQTSTAQLENLMHEMTEEHGFAWVRICVSEMVTFFGKATTGTGMPGFLTDMYDCPSERYGAGTISRGETLIKDSFTTILTASTPSWLIRAINPDIIEGGFTSRTMFICDETPKRKIAWSDAPTPNGTLDKFARELEDIRETAMDYPDVVPTGTALKVFENWYKRRVRHTDPFRNSFEGREDAHILRLAATLCINDYSWVITPEHVRTAMEIVGETKRSSFQLFRAEQPADGMVKAIDKIRERLINAGKHGVTQNQLRQMVVKYIDASNLRRILAVMHELNMVDRFEVGEGIRRTTLWRATNRITGNDALKAVNMGLDVIDETQ